MEQQVILVNANDEATGTMAKMEVHEKGLLHRAFSVFIFNKKGEMLLQQRALNKYHSGGLWTNACCSHPEPGEAIVAAAERRLKEEMGFETPLKKIFDFIYKADLGNGLQEHEFDHVLVGEYEGPVPFNHDEVKDICYKSINSVRQSVKESPESYTVWFRIAFAKVADWYAAIEN